MSSVARGRAVVARGGAPAGAALLATTRLCYTDRVDQPAAIDPTLRAETDPSASDSGELEPLDLEAQWIDHFAVLRKLGEGGMGTVYAAYDEQLERRVALKLLHRGENARLLREAQALARVSHPHVVQIYEVGLFRGRVFVAMEFVEGPTLAAWLAAAPREVDEILDVFVQAGRGLAAAHERGLVHRDFKPGNVIVGADGRVRVLDFGLARAGDMFAETGRDDHPTPRLRPDASLLTSPLTQTGALVGTPAYMSPEQHAGAPVDARSDQFSFCAALHEALHGQRAFAGDSLPELAANVIAGTLRRPTPRGDLAPAISAAIVRGLAADPAARWPTMAELLEVLAGSRGLAGVLDDRRARALIGLFVLALSIAIFALAYLLFERPDEATPEQMVLFALLQGAFGLAALPLAYRRLRRPRQRALIHFGLVMFAGSLVTRVFFWRAGYSGDVIGLAETLVFAASYAVLAVTLRLAWVMLTVPILFTALVLWIEFGFSPQLIPLSWIATVSVAVYGVRREVRAAPGPARPNERTSSIGA